MIGRPGGIPLHERVQTENDSMLACQVFPQAEMVGPQVCNHQQTCCKTLFILTKYFI